MPFLHIQLLGDFLLLADGEPVVGLHRARLQSCLAYFLRHCHVPQSRRQVAFLFWPDSTEKQAQTNLRKTLHHLRNRLPQAEQFLQNDTQMVWWAPDAPCTVWIVWILDLTIGNALPRIFHNFLCQGTLQGTFCEHLACYTH